MPPQRRFVFTAPPPRCDVAESSTAARALRGQYDFVNNVEAGQGLIRSPGHDTRTVARAADRAKDVSYARALQAFEHKMMTSIEEFNLRTDRRDIRLEIDVVRGQRTAYETELQEVRQAYWKRIRLKRDKSEQKQTKADKNGKRVEAGKSLKQLQWVEQEKLSKMQKEWPKMQTAPKMYQQGR
nr:hypothetical protein [Tanacetum cinerariifolium]